VLAGEQATPAADIYSFGVVLHEMLFAHRPESASSTEVKLALPAAKLRRIRSIVAKCLDRDPNRRFARAGAAAQALDAAFRYEPLATMSRRRMLIGSSAAALVATGSFWTEREQVEEWSANLLHPIPRPRHVAVMPADAHLTVDDASLLNGLMDTVGTTLARAELAERDLVVLPPRFLLDQKVEGISQALGLLGANLILSAALRRSEKAVHITIQLAEAATGKLLRSAELSCAAGIIYTLSALAADKAARLLNVPRRDFLRSTGGETSNPEAFAAFERGRNALNNGTPEQAITDLQKAVDIDPDFALAWAILGQAYATDYRLKQDWATLELAGRSAEKALRLDPALPAAYTGRASVERERGQYELAVRDLKTAMRLDPEDMDAQLTLARTYAVCGKLDWADRAFERVLDQRPNKWIALNDWGLLYYGRANYTRAAQLFREATMAAPQAALPWQNLGAAYLMMEELDEAARALEESIRLFPIAGAYSDRGTALFWAKKYRGAANDFERAVRLSPGNYTFWRNLGDCYSMLSEKKPQAAAAWERAAALARETLTINPKNGDAVADLAVLQAKLGRRAAALELMDRVQALGALNADRLFAEVQVCELAGRRDMALKLLKECVRLGYSQADIRYAPELQELRSDPRFKDLGIPAKSAG
jgi:tetratricopeptide (TPR) repeat protein